jgi:hypothetical protein
MQFITASWEETPVLKVINYVTEILKNMSLECLYQIRETTLELHVTCSKYPVLGDIHNSTYTEIPVQKFNSHIGMEQTTKWGKKLNQTEADIAFDKLMIGSTWG